MRWGLLHRRQILHRDIKPENLHVGDDGELRLLDFGLAYCPGLSEDAPSTLPGTPSYIAPEAFRGDPPSAQQDLYAVGVTLYFLLTGHFPYGEIEAFQRPRFGLPVSASRYRPDLPEWLAQSLERGVAADPQQRFETAEEWLLVLEQGERQSLSVRPRPLLEREPLKVWRTMAIAGVAGESGAAGFVVSSADTASRPSRAGSLLQFETRSTVGVSLLAMTSAQSPQIHLPECPTNEQPASIRCKKSPSKPLPPNKHAIVPTWHNHCITPLNTHIKPNLQRRRLRFPRERDQDKGVLARQLAGRLFLFAQNLSSKA